MIMISFSVSLNRDSQWLLLVATYHDSGDIRSDSVNSQQSQVDYRVGPVTSGGIVGVQYQQSRTNSHLR